VIALGVAVSVSPHRRIAPEVSNWFELNGEAQGCSWSRQEFPFSDLLSLGDRHCHSSCVNLWQTSSPFCMQQGDILSLTRR